MHIETLEGRQFLTATVVEGYPGYYEIHGDASDDVIDVSVSQSGQSFTLDGTTYSNVAYISVQGYGGDDFISIRSDEGQGSIAAGVAAGDGRDTVLVNFDGAIWGGGDDDILYLSDSFYGGVHGEDGNDRIYVSGFSLDSEVSGGSGHDYIDASGNYAGLAINGDSGKDTIYGTDYDDQIRGGSNEDELHGNGGNDTFYTREQDHDEIFGGSGTDIAHADRDGDGIYDVEFVCYG
jgi:Ca2+-binding RTX toxin-like protein